MKFPIVCLLAAAMLVPAAVPSIAASGCTSFVRIDEADNEACMKFVGQKTRAGGFTGKRVDETFFFWFGTDLVTTRCIDGNLVAMAGYHKQNDRACPLLRRVKDTIDGNR